MPVSIPGRSAAGEGRQDLDHCSLAQGDARGRPVARLLAVDEERGPGQDPLKRGGGRVARQHGGEHLRQRARGEDVFGDPGGLLRGRPVAHGHHCHVGYPRSHRIRATLPAGPSIVSLSPESTPRRRWQQLSELLLLTSAAEPPGEILPAIGLLLHTIRTAPAEAAAVADPPAADAVLVDARRDLARARELCRLLRGAGIEIPLLAVLTEGGLAAVTADWGTDDVILNTAGPAEVEARLRLAIGRQASLAPAAPDEIRSGDLAIDEATYSARLRTRTLDLTFKEFELLKFLAQHPGRVFTRAHLLQEVWGYDYFGGTRTVDVHVRRLRAKLGPEHEALIGTVRNVGYRFVPVKGVPEDRDGGVLATDQSGSVTADR